MTSSAVTLTRGATYQGRIGSLNGSDLQALVGAPDGRALRLDIKLAVNGSNVTGRVAARPAGASA